MTIKLPYLRAYPPHLEYLQRQSLFSDLTQPERTILGHLLHESDYLAGGADSAGIVAGLAGIGRAPS